VMINASRENEFALSNEKDCNESRRPDTIDNK